MKQLRDNIQLGFDPLSLRSRFVLGTWGLSGHRFGSYDQQEARDVIAASYDAGVRVYDSADFYGKGQSNYVLQQSLKRYSKDSYSLMLKAGLYWEGNKVVHDACPKRLIQTVDDSLTFFDRDYIDEFILHWPDRQRDLREACDVFVSLKHSGKIKRWGLANVLVDDLEILKDYAMDVCHLHYNPLHRDTERALKHCVHHHIETTAFSVFEQGLLANPDYSCSKTLSKRDVRRRNPYFSDKLLLKRIQALFLEDRSGYSVQHCLLYWVLNRGFVSRCILGTRYKWQFEAIMSFLDVMADSEIEHTPFYRGLDTLYVEPITGH